MVVKFTRSRNLFIVFWVLTTLVLTSCSGLLPASTLPTLIPTEYLSTAIALTANALFSDAITETPTVQLTPTGTGAMAASLEEIFPTLLPSPKPTNDDQTPSAQLTTATPLPPFEIPYADIQIISPGSLSKVVSPIQLHAFLVPGANGRVRVELYGEDGRLIYRKIFAYDSPEGALTHLWTDLDFEITGVAETARLVISTDDAYGRPQAVASEDLILLSLGNADINPPGDLLESIVIQEPAPKVLIQDGELVVSGLARTSSELPLLVEIITTDGKIIGSRLAGIASSPKGGHRLFAAKVPFTIYSPTWVRVIVSERGTRLAGATRLSSVEVLLGP